MGTRMKTTIDISEALFQDAKREAARSGTTLRALVERGLRLALQELETGDGYVMEDRRVDGDGINPDFADGGWERVRDEIYRGRGS